MPVPAEADSKQGSISNSQQKQQQQPANSVQPANGVSNSVSTSPSTTPSIPAPPTPPLTSSAHKDEAASPRMNESVLSCSNGGSAASSPIGSAASSPIEVASEDQPPLKIFVGGLSWQTSEDKLRDIFEHYGEVTECNIMKDPVTKKSRGFGFVTFKGAESVKKVLDAHDQKPISIDEKMIDPKIAVPPKRLSNKVKRIFVGGLSSDSCDEDLKEYFEQFGKVMESQLMYDRNTSRHRGFGFVTFEHEEPAEKVCSIQYHDIKGKKVEVKVAQTKEALAMQQGRGRMLNQRNYGSNYNAGYPNPGYTQFYPSHPYPMELIAGMGGYSTGPVMLGGGGAKPNSCSKNRGYSQYAFAYPPGGWGDHCMGGGFYGGYGVPIPMMGRHMAMDPNSMDFMAEQFQGLALGGGYYNHSPPSGTQYPGGMDNTSSAGGSYSPPHNLSPKDIASPSAVSGYNSVQNYTGSHSNSYAVAQPSY